MVAREKPWPPPLYDSPARRHYTILLSKINDYYERQENSLSPGYYSYAQHIQLYS